MREKMFNYNLIEANRIRLGLTQRKLADFCGVTPQAVSLWEEGRCMPQWVTVIKLSGLFGINPASFFDSSDHKSDRAKRAVAS